VSQSTSTDLPTSDDAGTGAGAGADHVATSQDDATTRPEVDDAEDRTPTPPAVPGAGRAWPTPIGTQRALQIVLGLFWIFDAALQYQPFMFGNQFVPSYITANASGQPEPISWLITTAGHFISPDVAVWNTFFATIQLLIGIGLLYRPTVRPALVTMFIWAFGVWMFGEGFGGLLTGTASALSGAPGSVFLYGCLGVMAWPRRPRGESDAELAEPADGVASSGAAHGVGGIVTPLAVWSGFWFLAAILFLLPANRVGNSVSGAITSMADGQPSWYATFLTHVGNWFGSAGTTQTWILAVVSVIIGLGPLVTRRYEGFLAAGLVLSVLFWVTAQGVGGVLTGSGTDPNTAPLIAVLALAMVPTRVADPATWSSPLGAILRRRPALVGAGAVGFACACILAATYPVAAAASGGGMSGMSGMSMSDSSTGGSMSMAGMSPSTQTAGTAHCSRGNNGVPHNGLDITNSPNMSMGSQPGATMNMNGADATAAAGLNATTPDWSYTGPALPAAEANQLLAEGANGPSEIHMAASGCAQEPTFGQEIGALDYVAQTSAAAAKYPMPSDATAGGYVLVSPADYPVTYYVNPTIAAANEEAQRALDPTSIDGLVYAATPGGQEVLAAAMYISPRSVSPPSMPYGALVQWHQRTAVCTAGDAAAAGTGPLQITGSAPCTAGTTQTPTPYLTMVWQLPVAGGPLAIQPPDVQIVEAAVMATS